MILTKKNTVDKDDKGLLTEKNQVKNENKKENKVNRMNLQIITAMKIIIKIIIL